MTARLQDQTIKSAKAPAKGRLEIKDGKVDGLMLRVTTNGVKTFALVYRVPGEHKDGPSKTGAARKGKPHRMTLGRYPMLSLQEARKKADLLLADIDMGIDPRPKQLTEVREQNTNTVEAVTKRFVIQECAGLASASRVERTLELHVLPALGKRAIESITRPDIHALIDALIDKGQRGAARETLKHVHRLFDFAYDRGAITVNPAAKLKRKDLKSKGKANRALTDEELKAIWKAVGAIGYPHGPWIQLLMLTGKRRDEWAKAQRPWIDNADRSLNIPEDKYKTGIPHSVPLGARAWEIIEGLPLWNQGDFLFSTNGGANAIDSAGDAKKKIDRLTGPLDKWTFHCFRVTCKTRMAALGIRPDHSEAVLGHTKKGMDEIYNRHDYEAEKRAALDLYEAHLMEVVGS